MSFQIQVVDLTHLPPANQLLSGREQALFQAFRFPKRRGEWLGGRFALKTLAARATGALETEIELLPQPSGKPRLLVRGEESPLAFSLTHSHGFAAAALSQDEPFLGIDLEKIEKRLNAWAQDFFHPDELTGTDERFLTALWTQKEALVKVLGTGLSLNSFEVRCVRGVPAFFGRAAELYKQLGSPALTVETGERVPGFMFTVAHGRGQI